MTKGRRQRKSLVIRVLSPLGQHLLAGLPVPFRGKDAENLLCGQNSSSCTMIASFCPGLHVLQSPWQRPIRGSSASTLSLCIIFRYLVTAHGLVSLLSSLVLEIHAHCLHTWRRIMRMINLPVCSWRLLFLELFSRSSLWLLVAVDAQRQLPRTSANPL